MEQIARRKEASPTTRQRRSLQGLPLEVDLRDRIRSLLLSRNEKRPPKTPCPTPDYVYLARHLDQLPTGNYIAPPRNQSFSPERAVEELFRYQSLYQEMGATRFDGPAGQFQTDGTLKTRRSLSHPNNQDGSDTSVDRRSISHLSGLNFNAQPFTAGKPFAGEGNLNRSKLPTRSRGKALEPKITYTLRTVPPKPSIASEDRPQLSHQHIPGSFRSETDPLADQTGQESLLLQGRKISNTDDPAHGQHNHGSQIKAVDALHMIQDHLESSNHPAVSVRISTSSSTLKSLTSDPSILKVSRRSDNHQDHKTDSSENEPFIIKRVSSIKNHKSQSLAPEGQLAETTIEPYSEYLSQVSDQGCLTAVKQAQSQEIFADLPPLPESPEIAGLATKADSHKAAVSPNPAKNLKKPLSSSLSHSTCSKASVTCGEVSAGPKSEMHLSIQTKPLNQSKRKETDNTDESELLRKNEQQSESLTRVITQLESLLKDALDIADSQSGFPSEHLTQKAPREPAYGSHESFNSTDTSSSVSSTSDLEGSAPAPPSLRASNSPHHIRLVGPQNTDHIDTTLHKDYNPTPIPDSLVSSRYQSTIKDSKIPLVGVKFGVEKKDIDPGANARNDSDKAFEACGFSDQVKAADWALPDPVSQKFLSGPQEPASTLLPDRTQEVLLVRNYATLPAESQPGPYTRQRPPIKARGSSLRRKNRQRFESSTGQMDRGVSMRNSESTSGPYVADFKDSALHYHPIVLDMLADKPSNDTGTRDFPSRPKEEDFSFSKEADAGPQSPSHPTNEEIRKGYSLKHRHHFSVREPHGFSLSRSHRRAPIARDWNVSRKRFVATITCINTAFLGLLIGIYAGEVPAIQYIIADEHHYTILGNVVFFLGLAATTIFFWPLPLLHGRKPYTLAGLTLLMLLQFPQALVVATSRSPYVATYRVGLLVPRALAGLVMGFANINFKTTLLDLFGASLQSGNPHQEIVDENDVRRHGGGMGVWLGIWTWCAIGSIGVGFWIGASIISSLAVAWGFWVTIILNAVVILLNVITPEVRRSAYRRSMAEVRSGTDVSRRIARGEIKMHLEATGPVWWWEEVSAGHTLSVRMLKQPGFAILALYMGWIYGQVVLVIVVSLFLDSSASQTI